MSTDFTTSSPALAAKSRELAERWRLLCARYLPRVIKGSIWRCSRGGLPGDPPQGWKLHVSATLLNAPDVLESIAPFLSRRSVRFKAPNSLRELVRLNSGICYGYSQVGKVFTVYPQTEEEAVRLAWRLHELTSGLRAPAVPFDLWFRPGSNVFYRYGAFDSFEMSLPDGSRISAIRDPYGKPVPDLREPGKPKPEWVDDPFAPRRPMATPTARGAPSHLATNLRVLSALTQRGRGGVYLALDRSASPPRVCLLKEGRRDGEVTWDGRDGRWRVSHEARVLASLREHGVEVPHVYSSFEVAGHHYLATEFIDGETLEALLARRRRRLSVVSVLGYSLQLATLLARIHEAGWAWRDCKPANLMVTKRGRLRPLDFEGANLIVRPDPLAWVTPAYSRPAPLGDGPMPPAIGDDLYALGAVIYLLLTGRTPAAPPAFVPAVRLRRGTPPEVCRLVTRLLSHDRRPTTSARAAVRRLRLALKPVRTGRGR